MTNTIKNKTKKNKTKSLDYYIEKIKNKKTLSIFLSKLRVFNHPKAKLEQYCTPSNIAGDVLWEAYMRDDIKNKIIADFGAGTGILGIGALVLVAKKVYFVEKDKKAIEVLIKNLKEIERDYEIDYKIIHKDVADMNPNDFSEVVDVIIQNPPFGTKKEHADKIFLEKAFQIATKVYSFHKTSTEKFIKAIAKDFNMRIIKKKEYLFPLKKEFWFQKANTKEIQVSCWVFEKH